MGDGAPGSGSQHRRVSMRVACVTPMYPGPTNPAFGVFVQRLNRALRARGMDVEVLTRPAGRRGLRSYLQMMAGAARFSMGAPEVVHLHYLGGAAIPAWFLAQRRSVPLVVTVHGSDVGEAAAPVTGAPWRLFLKQVRGVHAVSRHLMDRLDPLLGARAVERLVSPMGVDLEVFALRPQGPPSPLRLLVVGHYNPLKGWDDALRAMTVLRREHPQAQLLAVGAGDSNWLRGLSRRYGVEDAVEVIGALEPEGLAALYRRAHLVWVPSRREGLGLVGLEAMACGVPVISTRVGGLRDYIRHGYNAWVVPVRDPWALYLATQGLLANPRMQRRLVDGGYQTATGASADACAEKVEDLYRRVVSRPG